MSLIKEDVTLGAWVKVKEQYGYWIGVIVKVNKGMVGDVTIAPLTQKPELCVPGPSLMSSVGEKISYWGFRSLEELQQLEDDPKNHLGLLVKAAIDGIPVQAVTGGDR